MPSAFLAHAVDADGDGKRDLWHSPADALASTAAVFADAGWHAGAPCEYEIALPNNFPYEDADPDNAKAEFAIIVRTDMKSHGLGRILMERLIAYARARGIGEIFGPYRDRLIACDDPLGLAVAMERVTEASTATLRQEAEELAAFVATRFVVTIMADSVLAGYHDAIERRGVSPAKTASRLAPARGAPPVS